MQASARSQYAGSARQYLEDRLDRPEKYRDRAKN